MADEVKETVETTEAPAAEEVKVEAKAEKKKVNIDTEKLKGQAVGALGKVKEFFVTKPGTAKWVVIASLIIEALLAFSASFVYGLLALVLAAVSGYGVFVTMGAKADAVEEKTEE